MSFFKDLGKNMLNSVANGVANGALSGLLQQTVLSNILPLDALVEQTNDNGDNPVNNTTITKQGNNIIGLQNVTNKKDLTNIVVAPQNQEHKDLDKTKIQKHMSYVKLNNYDKETEGKIVNDNGKQRQDIKIPTWGYDDFINERNILLKGLHSPYAVPGYFYFKIFFDFDSLDGLIGGIINVSNIAHGRNTAAKYLDRLRMSNNYTFEDPGNRLNALSNFVRLLSYINCNAPWFFKGIVGLNDANTPILTDFNKDRFIEIQTNPDAIDMRLTTLMELYKFAAYDDVTGREILPDNLRKFDMYVLVYNTPIKRLHTGFNSYKYKTTTGFEENNAMSFKMFAFKNCEFDVAAITDVMPNSITNESPFQIGGGNIKIKYDKVFTYVSNEFNGILFGSDGIYLQYHNDKRIKAIADTQNVNNIEYGEAIAHNNLSEMSGLSLGNIWHYGDGNNVYDVKMGSKYHSNKLYMLSSKITESRLSNLLNTGIDYLFNKFNLKREKAYGRSTFLDGWDGYSINSEQFKEKIRRLKYGRYYTGYYKAEKDQIRNYSTDYDKEHHISNVSLLKTMISKFKDNAVIGWALDENKNIIPKNYETVFVDKNGQPVLKEIKEGDYQAVETGSTLESGIAIWGSAGHKVSNASRFSSRITKFKGGRIVFNRDRNGNIILKTVPRKHTHVLSEYDTDYDVLRKISNVSILDAMIARYKDHNVVGYVRDTNGNIVPKDYTSIFIGTQNNTNAYLMTIQNGDYRAVEGAGTKPISNASRFANKIDKIKGDKDAISAFYKTDYDPVNNISNASILDAMIARYKDNAVIGYTRDEHGNFIPTNYESVFTNSDGYSILKEIANGDYKMAAGAGTKPISHASLFESKINKADGQTDKILTEYGTDYDTAKGMSNMSLLESKINKWKGNQ